MKKVLAAASLLALCLGVALAQSGSGSVVDGPKHDGQFLTVDLPADQHIKNIGSKVDGAGMCVMSSIEMAARSLGLEQMRGLRDWCAKEPGGGYPSKVDKQLSKWFATKGITPIPYMQYEGPNPAPVLEALDKSGRMACITYGTSPRYGGQRIAHMVCSPGFRGSFGIVLDNNFPGENNYEWMSREELVRRIKYPGNSGWVFAWLSPASPPAPKNKGAK